MAIGDDLIRSRAEVVLYCTSYAYYDDFGVAFEHAQASVEAAEAAGDIRAAISGLTAAYEICVECGRLEEADRIGDRINVTALPLGYRDTPPLHFARAIRAAIDSDFQASVRILAALPDQRCTLAERTLRDCYRALFSVPLSVEDATSRLELVVEDIRSLEQGPLSLTDVRNASLARVLAALASAFLGRNAEAIRMLSKRRPILNSTSIGRLSDCVAAIVRMRIHVAERADESAVYDSIAGFLQGWRLCFAALVSAVRASARSAGCPLTPMQLTVLRELAKGSRTRDVAQMLGMSVNTHANHVREIIKRLKCSGRVEALQIARSRGYV